MDTTDEIPVEDHRYFRARLEHLENRQPAILLHHLENGTLTVHLRDVTGRAMRALGNLVINHNLPANQADEMVMRQIVADPQEPLSLLNDRTSRTRLRGLLLGLLRWRGRGGLGLLEILETKDDGEAHKHHDEERLHVAATTAGAAWTTLRLQIGILKFGQRLRPVSQTLGRPKSAAASMVTVRGQCAGAMRGPAPGRVRRG